MSAFRRCCAALALIALAAFLPSPAFAGKKPSETATTTATTSVTAPAPRPAPLFGFNSAVNVLNLAPEIPADLQANAGATSTRVGIHWSWIEPERNVYNWGQIDGIYAKSLARGIRPLLQIYGSPYWTWGGATQTCASFPQCNFPPARSSDADWQDLLRVMTARYPQAVGMEIWNEPNLAWAWEGAPDAARYTELLKLGYDAVKAVNPAMPVIGGSLAPVVSDNINASGAGVRPFLQAMYDGGAKGKMDAIAVHPYPYEMDFAHAFKTMSLVKETRTANGDSVPLWITEYGVSTTGDGAVTEAQQAIALPALYSAFRNDPEVNAIYVHTLIEPAGASTSDKPGFGIVRRDLSVKPAYCNLAAANASAYACTPLTAGIAQAANWEAQTLLQRAADAARKVHVARGAYLTVTAADLNAVDSTLNAKKVVGDLIPSLTADPSVIAVYPTKDGRDGILLCNASKAVRSYCIYTFWRGQWTYGSLVGTVNATAGATVNGGSTTW